MPESADGAPGFLAIIRKRWRGWLRAVHRDFGYLAVGFTVIYALSGLAINHIADWDPNFTSSERTIEIAPISADVPDAEAVQRVITASGTGTPDDIYRAGDELRLTYASGATVTLIGDSGLITMQAREPRFFLRVANWLHYNRGKKAWTYCADVFAVMLLYLAISGIFMIKGRLGLKWRGTILIGLGVAFPIAYVTLSGGPGKHATSAPAAAAPAAAPPAPPPVDDGFEMKPRVPPPSPS